MAELPAGFSRSKPTTLPPGFSRTKPAAGGPEPSAWQKIFQPLVDLKSTDTGKSLIYASPDESQNYLPSVPQTTADTYRSVANAISLGGADRLTSITQGTTAQEEAAKTEAARARVGPLHYATDIAAQIATIPEYGAGKLGGWALGGLGKLLGYGAEGAAASGVTALNEGKSWDEIKRDAELGGAFGVGGTVVGDVVGNVANRVRGGGGTYKDSDAVLKAMEDRFKTARATQTEFGPQVVDNMLSGMENTLKAHQATGGYAKLEALKEIQDLRAAHGGKSISAGDLEAVDRQLMKNLADKGIDTSLAHDLRRHVTDVFESNAPLESLTGRARPDVSEAMLEGKKLAGQGARAKDVEQAALKAERKAGRSWSDTLESQRRAKFAKLQADIEATKTGAGFSPKQKELVDSIAGGDFINRRALSRLGNVNRYGAFPLASAVAGGFVHPAFGMLMAAAPVARGIANYRTGNKIASLAEMVRNNTDVLDTALQDRLRQLGATAGSVYARE